MIKDHPIFIESINFIRTNLEANDFNYLENKVLERLVHTAGDFNIQNYLEFSEDACENAIQSLKEGSPILTDLKGWKELSAKNVGIKSPIVVIGSSPTALVALLDHLNYSNNSPSLIIGMPVGFIGVEKSKQKLLRTNYSRIVINSTRGGAAMAAATVNALLRECI